MASKRQNSDPQPQPGAALIELDPWLAPYADKLAARHARFEQALGSIVDAEGSLDGFSRGHQYFGFNRGERDGQPGLWYREWAPQATALNLTGDFNGWDRLSHPLGKDQYGVWSIFLPDQGETPVLAHGSLLKVHVHSALGPLDRIPAYIRRCVYDPQSHNFTAQLWDPPEPYAWQHDQPARPRSLRIYEAHVGMATEDERIGTYREFAERVLPRVAAAGYNAIQLMAVQEHPYYGSFGYQVSSFFAPSSRFGTPEELKYLIDRAHAAGLLVLLDLVHSHAVKNVHEGLNNFDGTDHQYFHAGSRGQHPAWGSLCFDYGKYEVQRFLLSNVRYWLEEFRFDGFRFDGVTSMLYHDHGLGRAFSDYDQYFPPHVEEDALTYLQLANTLIHEQWPQALSIAEDMSGMIGMARPVGDGGLGFDYRLAMGIPDFWIQLLREKQDEQWQMGQIFGALTNRRAGEKHVGYAESHDQALVGDKTIAMWLMDADMYFHMNKGSRSVVVDRGVALHKLIRLITFALGGEAYLNFMGNEFGHPEWIDFPREGNNWSFKYARRQWSLVDDPLLRYRDLNAFDRDMIALDERDRLLGETEIEHLCEHEDDKVLVFRRAGLVFAFNFHPSRAHVDYRVPVSTPADHRLVLNSDDMWYGGHGEVVSGQYYPHIGGDFSGKAQSLKLYLPPRVGLVLKPVDEDG